MEEELDEEMVSELCMFMRVIDLFDKNKYMTETNPELGELVDKHRATVKEIMDLLTDEQKDFVLEEHKFQKECLEEEEQQRIKRNERRREKYKNNKKNKQ